MTRANSTACIATVAALALTLTGCASGPDATARSLAERVLSTGSDGLCDGAMPGQAVDDITIVSTAGDDVSQLVEFEGTSPAIGEAKGTVSIDIDAECVTSVTVSPR